jgi:hypothetical protein
VNLSANTTEIIPLGNATENQTSAMTGNVTSEALANETVTAIANATIFAEPGAVPIGTATAGDLAKPVRA